MKSARIRAPTYSRALEIFFEDLEALIPREWMKAPRRSMNMMEFRMLWGATIRIFGMNNPKIVEGPPWDKLYLDEVADTILPTTASSPGAKAAKTGAFMALMVTDTYEPDDAKVFRAGLSKGKTRRK